MPLRPFLLSALVLCLVASSTSAQSRRFGIAGGFGEPAGQSRVLVDFGSYDVTGAGSRGLHLRGWFEVPLGSESISFQGEFFHNRLSSRPNSFSVAGDTIARQALLDLTTGVMGNLAIDLRPRARVSPRFVMGMGLMHTILWSNPDESSAERAEFHGGLGIGVQTGLGLRVRMARADLLLEGRFVQPLNPDRGSAFWPFTVGVTF